MQFVQKLEWTVDAERLLREVAELTEKVPYRWNSLCLTHPSESKSDMDAYYIGCGPIYDRAAKQWIRREDEFSIFHRDLGGTYLQEIYLQLQERTNNSIGRFRIMNLKSKSCYYWHLDLDSPRYHISLKTNRDCMFLFEAEDGSHKVEKIPADGHIYEFSSHLHHTAINASREERIHLVFSNKNLWKFDWL